MGMSTCISVPNTLRAAGRALRGGFASPVEKLAKADFVRAWCAIAYIYPGLHPEGFEEKDNGWPRVLKRFAADAWRRAEIGELDENEMYVCDAQWAGLYDRMHTHEDDETARRFQIAADYGEPADG